MSHKKASAISFVAGAVLTGLVAVFVLSPSGPNRQAALAPAEASSLPPAGASTSAPQPAFAPGMPQSFTELSKRVGPAVVYISVRGTRQNPFARQGMESVEAGQGTGFIVSSDGYILTNEHVVSPPNWRGSGRPEIDVRLHDDRVFRAKIVGVDQDTDIGLLKIEGGPFPVAPMGDSDGLEIGEWVMAIGNPFGLSRSVTAGIVSAKSRRDVAPGGRNSNYYDFIQTDASINPGNSGGPLINLRGEVVGINSAVSARGQGIGFAIPINMAKAITPLLKQHGRVPRSYIGVRIAPVENNNDGSPPSVGALITGVVKDSAAHQAGLEAGDIILSFDGQAISRHDDLPWLASMAGIGRTVMLDVRRGDGSKRSVKVTLQELR